MVFSWDFLGILFRSPVRGSHPAMAKMAKMLDLQHLHAERLQQQEPW